MGFRLRGLMRPHRLGDSGYYNANEIRISAFRNTTHMGHTVYDNVDSSSKRSIHVDIIAFKRIASVQQIIQIGKIIFVSKKININGKNTYFSVINFKYRTTWVLDYGA